MNERVGKREREREWERKRIKKIKKKKKNIATYCNKLLKLFKFGNFDVEHVLVFWAIK